MVPGNPEPEIQDFFLEQYQSFMATKKQDEGVFFMDAVHPVHNSIASEGWILKGEVKRLKTNSARQRLNIHGVMNADTYETPVLVSESNINQDSTVALLRQLEALHPHLNQIYVILDNAKYHYSKKVMSELKGSRIKLVFLPPYSPELNLIERLWHVFKKNVLYNRFYEKFKDFKKACLGFFRNYDKYLDEIENIMGDGLFGLMES